MCSELRARLDQINDTAPIVATGFESKVSEVLRRIRMNRNNPVIVPIHLKTAQNSLIAREKSIVLHSFLEEFTRFIVCPYPDVESGIPEGAR